MKSELRFFCFSLLSFTFLCSSSVTSQGEAPQNPKPLATESFNLPNDAEVGLEIDARSPGASWIRKGAEAASLLISVDGKYNQDVLLWAGEESFTYRVMLGRLSTGKHTVSVALNAPRSATAARTAEVKSLRPLLFATPRNAENANEEQLALAHTPFLYARANTIDRFTDIPLLMYYEILPETGGVLTVRYTVIFTNEDGGTQTAALMARWGRATDIEWVYQIRLRAGKIVEETYQGVEHETKFFTGQRASGNHPLLAVASDNNNFSDLASSAVRFNLLPTRARLEKATRESIMDMYPQTYRVMTEELLREGRISETRVDVNSIADPRDYLYIEAGSEQDGATIAFDVKVAGQSQTFASDLGDARLRIDRSGNFRTAVRLPKNTSPAQVEAVIARCQLGTKSAEGRCKNLNLLRLLMLDQTFVPRPLQLLSHPESSLAAGQMMTFKLRP